MPSKSTILKNLEKAKEISYNSNFFRQGVGAVLYLGNKRIAHGVNSAKSYPIQKRYNQYRNFRTGDATNFAYIHAEMDCLQKTKYLDIEWSDTILYVGRRKRDNTQGLAKPCPACERAIRDRGIGTVYYTLEGSGFDIL